MRLSRLPGLSVNFDTSAEEIGPGDLCCPIETMRDSDDASELNEVSGGPLTSLGRMFWKLVLCRELRLIGDRLLEII